MPRSLRFFLLASAAITAVCLLAELVCAFVLHLGPAVYRQPLFVGISFMDFECYHQCFADLHTARFFGPAHTWPWAYPAPIAVLFAFFFTLPGDPLNWFLASVAAALLLIGILFTRALIRRGLSPGYAIFTTASLALLSYPIAFAFERANAEFYVFFVLALGLWAFVSPAMRHYPWLAAFLFGLAGSMKLFPLVFLGLLLSRREYRAFAFGLLTTALATLASLWWLGPTVLTAWQGIRQGGAIFRQAFLLHTRTAEYGYDHSLVGFYRRFFPLLTPPAMSVALTVYLALAALAGLALYWLRIRRLPLLNQVLALTVAAILLPPVSFDYTLIHLYLPLALLLLTLLPALPSAPVHSRVPFQAPRRNPVSSHDPAPQRTHAPPLARGLYPILLALAILVSSESEFIWRSTRVAAQLKCLVLVLLFALSLLYPQPSRYDLHPAA